VADLFLSDPAFKFGPPAKQKTGLNAEDAKALVLRELRAMMPKLSWEWNGNQVGIRQERGFTRATLRAEDWLDIIDAAYNQGREDERNDQKH